MFVLIMLFIFALLFLPGFGLFILCGLFSLAVLIGAFVIDPMLGIALIILCIVFSLY